MRYALPLALLVAAPLLAESPAPDFGPNVLILNPSTPDAQRKINAIFSTQEAGQFNDKRYAILLKPGQYNLDVQVGFYTQVAGLGHSPDDVHVTGAVRVKAAWMKGNATCNFWRSAENLSVTPTLDDNVNVFAVSQGTSLRRMHVKGDLAFSDHGWSSGGFLADSVVDGTVHSGSQQQWLSRNTSWKAWDGGAWNMVFVGADNPPPGAWPDKPYTVIPKTPLIREKPYLTIDSAGQFSVSLPRLARDTHGPSWQSPADSVPIAHFYIAHPDKDTAATMNAALAAGKHLLLTPGLYPLEAPLHVTRPNTILLGLGYPTLTPTHAHPAIITDDVDGLTLSSLLLEAGPDPSDTLLRVGPEHSANAHAANPTHLFDIFCRVGGAVPGKARCMLTINSPDVVADNLWLWRADHGAGAGWTQNLNANALIVNGQNATIYGLFCEHSQQYQALFNANGAKVFFYQSEFPYDPPSQEAWSPPGTTVRGFASYKVAPHVTSHEAHGLAIYSVFFAAPVNVDSAVESPTGKDIHFSHLVTAKFAGKPGSGSLHILNDQGGSVVTDKSARLK